MTDNKKRKLGDEREEGEESDSVQEQEEEVEGHTEEMGSEDHALPWPFNAVTTLDSFSNAVSEASRDIGVKLTASQRYSVLLHVVPLIRTTDGNDDTLWFIAPRGYQTVTGGEGKPVTKITHPEVGAVTISQYNILENLVNDGYIFQFPVGEYDYLIPDMEVSAAYLLSNHNSTRLQTTGLDKLVHLEKAWDTVTGLLRSGDLGAAKTISHQWISANYLMKEEHSVAINDFLGGNEVRVKLRELYNSLAPEDNGLRKALVGLEGSLLSGTPLSDRFHEAAVFCTTTDSKNGAASFVTGLHIPFFATTNTFRGHVMPDGNKFPLKLFSELVDGDRVSCLNRAATGAQLIESVLDVKTRFVVIPAGVETVHKVTMVKGGKPGAQDEAYPISILGVVTVDAQYVIEFQKANVRAPATAAKPVETSATAKIPDVPKEAVLNKFFKQKK